MVLYLYFKHSVALIKRFFNCLVFEKYLEYPSFFHSFVHCFLTTSQIPRLLWRSEAFSSGPFDGETSPAVYFLPHQLPAETEPEWQLWNTDWILGEILPPLFLSVIKFKCFMSLSSLSLNHLWLQYSGYPCWTATGCRLVRSVYPSFWNDFRSITHCTPQRYTNQHLQIYSGLFKEEQCRSPWTVVICSLAELQTIKICSLSLMSLHVCIVIANVLFIYFISIFYFLPQ